MQTHCRAQGTLLSALWWPKCEVNLKKRGYMYTYSWTSLVAQTVNLPTIQETWVQSLGREDTLEKEKATHSSTLAWRIPWREEPGRLQSMGSKRVGHDWATSLSLSFRNLQLVCHYHDIKPKSFCLEFRRPGFDPWVEKVPWRMKWQPSPVLLPGESHGGRSLVGYSPWGRKELDMTSDLTFTFFHSAYKLNKQGDSIQPWCTPCPIWNQSVVPCPVLTVASWPAYRFLRRQVRWSDIPISLRIFHSLLWSTQSQSNALA